MKTLLNTMLCTALVLLLYITPAVSQTLDNYVIDESFDSGDLFREGGVMDLELLEDGRILIMNSCHDVTSPAGSYPIIFPDGNFSHNGEFCPTCVGHGSFGWMQSYSNGFLDYGFGGILKITSDFDIDNTFRFEYGKGAYSSFISNAAIDVLIEPDDNILVVGGFFTDSLNLNDIDTRYPLCRIDSTGAPDPDFPMLQVGGVTAPSYPAVRSIDTLSTGKYILAGKFSTFGGYEYTNVGKLNADFSVDTTFVNSIVNRASVPSFFIDSQDRIWANTTYSGLLSNPNDTLPFVRLLPNGEIDPDFTPPDVRWEYESGFSTISMVMDMIELPNGDFIFIGGFNRVNGLVHKGIMYMHEDGTVDETIFANLGADEASWGPNDTLRTPDISCLLSYDDGSILLGGTFSSFGGQPYSCLVKIRPQGVSVEENGISGSLKISPNPAGNYFQANFPEAQRIDHLIVSDISGKVLRKIENYRLGEKIVIAVLPAGAYIITGFVDGTKVYQGKVVKH